MIKFAIIAFLASCLLAAIAASAPARRSPPNVPSRSMIEFGAEPVTPATIRRVRIA